MTICLQRPPFWGPIFNVYNINLPLNNDHLSTKATNLGTRGWLLYTGLTVDEKDILRHFKLLFQISSYNLMTILFGFLSTDKSTKVQALKHWGIFLSTKEQQRENDLQISRGGKSASNSIKLKKSPSFGQKEGSSLFEAKVHHRE